MILIETIGNCIGCGEKLVTKKFKIFTSTLIEYCCELCKTRIPKWGK